MEPAFDFLALPTELIQRTALFIRYDELLELFKTSKQIRRDTLHSDIFWKHKTYRDFDKICDISPHPDGWRVAYQCCRGVISLDFIQALVDDKEVEAERILAINRELRVLDPNIQDTKGSTPLMWVASRGYPESACDELIEWKVDIHILNDRGYSALIHASLWGHLSIVEKLLKVGADPNVKSNKGNTALLYAVSEKHIPIVEKLLKEGADPNVQDKDGRTPLYRATKARNIDIVRKLLEGGAIPKLPRPQEFSALLRAINNDYVEIAELLINKISELGISY